MLCDNDNFSCFVIKLTSECDITVMIDKHSKREELLSEHAVKGSQQTILYGMDMLETMNENDKKNGCFGLHDSVLVCIPSSVKVFSYQWMFIAVLSSVSMILQ